jgi:uncharacterized membrane-anchored protein YitT (DUF2179 family)
MIEKYTLYVGLNDKETKTQKISTVEAYKIIENLLLNLNVEGATIFEAKGLYKHENGEYVTENTLRIEIMFVEKPIVKQLVDSIKLILNQESVAVQREVVESELW